MSTNRLGNRDFRVGDWVVHPTLARIERGDETVHVTPRAMAVLVHLAEANGAVVSRNDLLDAVWPRMAVTPDTLSQCLVELRRAFGDDAKNPQTIETIRKIGVRLIAPITVDDRATQQPTPAMRTQGVAARASDSAKALGHREPRWSRRLLAGTVIAAIMLGAVVLYSAERFELWPPSGSAASDRRSIAVLPLAYDGAADDRVRSFVDAIHDELLIRLASIEAFDEVVSRPAVLELSRTHKSALQIGRELNVRAVLEGRVRVAQDAIRLSVQLLDIGSGALLWGETYTKTLTAQDFFAVQSELTAAIAGALDAQLSADELGRLRHAPTTSTRALEFYLSGNEYWRRNDPINRLPVIVQQYTRATEEDPGFALAWARLGIAHAGMHFRGLDRTPARLALADAAIRKAFELAPALPEAHLARAALLGRGHGDFRGALAELVLAAPGLRQDPEFYFLRAGLYMHAGEWELSLVDHGTLLELDPRNVVYLRQRSLVETFKRDYAAVTRTLERVLELAPDDGTAHADQAFLALHAYGDTALASRYELSPPSATYSTALAATYVRWLAAIFERDYAKALSILDGSSEEPVFDGDLRNSFTPKSLLYARTYMLADRHTEATQHLQQAKSAIEKQPVSPHTLVALAEVQAALGDREGARAAIARVGETASFMQRSDLLLATAIRVRLRLGEHDQVLEELDRYLSGAGKWSIEGLAADPRLDPLRGDPRFGALIAKHKRT
jgi:DNA-binding winged helix-turn-helix (wHTH) protein/TolB-like protein/Flp pilus assembly protein TadD